MNPFAWFTPLRITLLVGAAVLALSGLAYVKHLQGQVDELNQEVVTEESRGDLREAETGAIVQYHTTERVIYETADPIIEYIEEAPGADDPVADDVLALWRDGIVGLRNGAGTADDPLNAAP